MIVKKSFCTFSSWFLTRHFLISWFIVHKYQFSSVFTLNIVIVLWSLTYIYNTLSIFAFNWSKYIQSMNSVEAAGEKRMLGMDKEFIKYEFKLIKFLHLHTKKKKKEWKRHLLFWVLTAFRSPWPSLSSCRHCRRRRRNGGTRRSSLSATTLRVCWRWRRPNYTKFDPKNSVFSLNDVFLPQIKIILTSKK